jgi:hypothetical protein
MEDSTTDVRSQILSALSHPEAEEGLYFRNFYHLHEEDERPAVVADQLSILDALKDLIAEGSVKIDESGPEAVFMLGRLSN